MKKVFKIIGIVLLVLIVVAIIMPKGNDTEVKKEDDSTVLAVGKTYSFDKFDFTLKSLSLVKGSDEKDALKYTYDWKNKDDDAAMPFMTFQLKGFQDGVEVDSSYFLDDVNLEKEQKQVKKDGEVTDCEAAVGYIDVSKKVELELSETFSFSDKKYTMELDPSTLK